MHAIVLLHFRSSETVIGVLLYVKWFCFFKRKSIVYSCFPKEMALAYFCCLFFIHFVLKNSETLDEIILFFFFTGKWEIERSEIALPKASSRSRKVSIIHYFYFPYFHSKLFWVIFSRKCRFIAHNPLTSTHVLIWHTFLSPEYLSESTGSQQEESNNWTKKTFSI